MYAINPSFSAYINVKNNFSNKIINFLVDTQAQISIIKINEVKVNEINKREIVKITGVTSGIIITQGTINLELNFDRFVIIHKFHVVQEDFNIPTRGIIGHDFITANKCNLLFRNDLMTIEYENIEHEIKLHQSTDENTIILPPRCETVRYFKLNTDRRSNREYRNYRRSFYTESNCKSKRSSNKNIKYDK